MITDNKVDALCNYSTEELRQEIERRKNLPPVQIPMNNINFAPVIRKCNEYIQNILSNDNYYSEAIKWNIFGAAMEAVYGKDIWDWINEREK